MQLERRSRVHGAAVPTEAAIQNIVAQLIQDIGVTTILQRARDVVLKPNFVISEDWHNGTVTSTPVIAAVAEHVRKTNPDAKITIGEGGFTTQTRAAFERNQIPALCNRLGLGLVDFNADDRVPVEIPGAKALKGILYLSKIAVECDCIISLPALKTHSLAVTTLSMKNFMGTMSNKSIMHAKLHEKILDLYSYFKPKAPFAIIDGYIGNSGDECSASPMNHGILLASTDFVALDTVGSFLMGQDLAACKYLAAGEQRGLGVADMTRIDVQGIEKSKFMKKYRTGKA